MKLTKRTAERLHRAAKGEAIVIRQGDDLLIYGLVRVQWHAGRPLYEVTDKGREALAENPVARCKGCPHPPHLGPCNGRHGGTAYRCGCLLVTPTPDGPAA